ncbi:MAG: hypothetical protein ABW128_18535, partial [Rhizorhabdus sp.]
MIASIGVVIGQGPGRRGFLANVAAGRIGATTAAPSINPNRRRDRAEAGFDRISLSIGDIFGAARQQSPMFILDSIDRIARISLDRPAARNAIAIDQWA